MNTPQGWARAKMRLEKGEVPQYGTLLEAYHMAAIFKEQKLEVSKNVAKMLASKNNIKNEAFNDAFNEFIEEVYPEKKQERKSFIEEGKEILDEVAGEVIKVGENNG